MEYKTDSKKSFQNLVATIYNSRTGSGQTNADTLVQNLPLSFLRSGYYGYSNGALNHRDTVGYYWSAQSYPSGTNPYANYLYFRSTVINPQDGNHRGYGVALRCLAR